VAVDVDEGVEVDVEGPVSVAVEVNVGDGVSVGIEVTVWVGDGLLVAVGVDVWVGAGVDVGGALSTRRRYCVATHPSAAPGKSIFTQLNPDDATGDVSTTNTWPNVICEMIE
jgi:hypothetical protein